MLTSCAGQPLPARLRPQTGRPSDTDFAIQIKTAEGVAYTWFLHGGTTCQIRP
ncbi:hypothetical protein [Nitrospirillum viridazoti]|uniref:hypothetical protein n=1 Tax=Nitrospirillum viridazoti TaxID=3144925 RepID=UPI001300C226|nr:hypothetical protein [Nitrospirillum amazonense]